MGIKLWEYPVELHHIGSSGNPEVKGAQREASEDHDITPHLPPGPSLIRPVVEAGTFQGQGVVTPHLFDVDQGALSLAEHQVLKGGKGEEFILGEHGFRAGSTR